MPRYLDATARTLLKEGRAAFRRFGLDESSLVQTGNDKTWIFPWQGTVTKIGAIALAVLALAGIHAATDIKTLENDIIVGGGAALSAYTVGKDLLHKIVDKVKGARVPHG